MRYAIIGCGDAAVRRFIPGLRSSRSGSLVAIASQRPAHRTALAERLGCASHRTYDEVLARDDVEVVYIGLPIDLHHEWCVRAIEAGKHVYCEKTFAPRLDQTCSVLQLAHDRGRRMCEGFMFRFHRRILRVRELVAAGVIGRLERVVSTFGFTLPAEDRVRRDPSRAMGVLNETGCYTIAAARLFFGREPTAVESSLQRRDGIDVGGTALLRFGNDVAECEFGFEGGYRNRCTLWGSEGLLTIDRAFTAPHDLSTTIEIFANRQWTESVPPNDHFANAIDAFDRAIVHNTDHEMFEHDIRAQAMTMATVRRSFPRSITFSEEALP